MQQGQGIDLVLLDLGLPDGDGTDFLLELRRKFSTPLIVISARQVEGAKIELLDAGADDYLVKPFGIGELLARMRVAMRHRGRPLEAAITQYQREGVEIDLKLRRVRREGRRGAPHAARVRPAGPPRPPGRTGGDAPQVADRRLGRRALRADALPAPLHGPAARQARSQRSRARLLLTEPGVGYRIAEPG